MSQTGQLRRDTHPGADFKDDPALATKTIVVSMLRSRYGYYIEDLSTKEMRSRWIAGGRIKIVDLHTYEVLAERTGYFRAIGRDAKYYWSGASAFQNQRICPHDSSLHGFLFAVLKPVQQVPNVVQLNSLQEQ